MKNTYSRRLVNAGLGVALVLGAGAATGILSAAASKPAPAAAASSVGGTITRSEVIQRAQYWVDQDYTYTQTGTYYAGPDGGKTYRRDCSGLVSMAWHLSTSLITQTVGSSPGFDTFTGKTVLPSLNDLLAGDAILRDGHMELFDAWKVASDHSQGAYVYSFNNTGEQVENPYTKTPSYVGSDGNTHAGALGFDSWNDLTSYSPIRYNNVVDDPTPPVGFAGRQLADLNGDGLDELVGRKADGTLWAYPHLATSTIAPTSWGPAVQIGAGWNIFDTFLFADLNGDGRPELIARKTDGTLWAYPHLATDTIAPSSWGAAVQIGAGWGVFDQIFAVDLNNDGRPELIGRKLDGTLWAYPHLATSTIAPTSWTTAVQIGAGWNIFTSISIADLGNDGNAARVGPELIGRKADGSLWEYPHNTSQTIAPTMWDAAKQIGAGWNVYTAIETGDITGDGRNELVGRTSNGTLNAYLHLDTDVIDSTSWDPGVQIGAGWNIFTLLD